MAVKEQSDNNEGRRKKCGTERGSREEETRQARREGGVQETEGTVHAELERGGKLLTENGERKQVEETRQGWRGGEGGPSMKRGLGK